MDKKLIYIGIAVVIVLVVIFFLLSNQNRGIVCGDGVCSEAEDITSCPNDCGGLSGEIYSVTGYNQLGKSGLAPGNYNVKGYVIYKYDYCPPCPEGAACAPCIYPHLILSDKHAEKQGYSKGGQLDGDELYLEPQDTNIMDKLELLDQYIMTVEQEDGESRIASYKKVESSVPNNGLSGITGLILLGPSCPVVRDPPNPQCADKLYVATVVVKSADGSSEVTR